LEAPETVCRRPARVPRKDNVALNDLLRVLWQRKLIIIAIVAVVIAAAFAATKLVTPNTSPPRRSR
jgi:uncharacterized protein involved in exopolysaccharide biosynthesis